MENPTFNNDICLEDAALAMKNKHLPKRMFVFFVALLVLLLVSPLMLVTAVFIKLTSPGPVFFKQERVGLMGEVFVMYKFRTMEVKADTGMHQDHITDLINNGQPMVKIDDHHRLIPCGKILRRLFIDELPQLINVIQGDMSLVGPRPAIPYEVQAYAEWHRKRLLAFPGMTGLWQVSGKNRLTFEQMVWLDIQYAKQCSFWLDLKILCKTPWTVVREAISKYSLDCD